MRLVEALQVTAAVFGAAASIFASAERGIVKRLRREGATSTKTAIDLPRLRPLARWHLARLVAHGAVVVGEQGRAHLDEAMYAPVRRKRKIVGASLAAITLAVVVVLYTIFG